MHHMNTPPTPKNIRVTVPVSPEVLELFQRLSAASGKSVGRLMAEWLDETREGLEPMIDIMVKFKTVPRAAVKALQLHANALTDMAQSAVDAAMSLSPEGDRLVDGKRSAAASRAASVFIGKGGLTPPSSNTGGKGRKTPKNDKGV